MPGDELAARRAAGDGDRLLEFGGDGTWRFASEGMEARGEHIRPEFRGAMGAAIDLWLKSLTEGGCGAAGVHVEPGLCLPVARALLEWMEYRERRDGARPVVPGLTALIIKFARETPSATLGPASAAGHGAVAAGDRPPPGAEWTVAEAAGHLRLSPQRVRRLCRDGQLRARRAGVRLWLVEAASVTGYRRSCD